MFFFVFADLLGYSIWNSYTPMEVLTLICPIGVPISNEVYTQRISTPCV